MRSAPSPASRLKMSRSRPIGSKSLSHGPNRSRLRPFLAASALLTAGAAGLGTPSAARSETLNDALAKAYFNNPNLNAQRSTTRAADENIPIANSGYMPHVTASGDVGAEYESLTSPATSTGSASLSSAGSTSGTSGTTVGTTTGTTTGGTVAGTGTGGTFGLASSVSGSSNANRSAGTTLTTTDGTTLPRGAGISVSQTLFDGLRTTNNIKSAESNVFSSRETLRNVEQSVLQSGAQSYMDLDLRNSNIKVLEEQLRQTQDRFKVGEVTRTDVAQAEASVAGARADYFAAQSQLQNSIASFRQVIGEQPTRLEPARPLDKGIPPSLENAIAVSQIEHPSIQSALHQVDVASLQVKIAEGALYPTLSLNGSAQQRYDVSNVPNSSAFVGSIVGSLQVPIYEGGSEYASIRQAKEQLGTAEFQVDVSRDNVRAAVISSWGLLVSSKAAVQADQAQVNAAEIALNGTREEARVGQRTTLDVLNAQQTLLNARVQLVGAQRDRVVATYAILASCGRLSASGLNLRLQPYNPTVHFEQVKDKWFGLRTPDGR
jgi:outer membrane protein